MIEILEDHYNKEMMGLDEQIQKLCSDNQDLTTNQKYAEQQTSLNEFMEQFNKKIVVNKNKKIMRELMGQGLWGKAYKWQTTQRGKSIHNSRQTIQQEKGITQNNDDDTDLISSIFSSSVSSRQNKSATSSNTERLQNKTSLVVGAVVTPAKKAEY